MSFKKTNENKKTILTRVRRKQYTKKITFTLLPLGKQVILTNATKKRTLCVFTVY